MKKEIENRLERFRKILLKENLDTMMVLIDENRHYLSGYTAEDSQFDETAGALFITDTRLVLATDSRFELQAGAEAIGYEIVCYKKGLAEELQNIVGDLKTKRLGFESIRMSYAQYKKVTESFQSNHINVEPVPTDNLVENLRIIKEEAEIDKTKAAITIAESAFASFKADLMPGTTEKEAAWKLEQFMKDAGADSIAFPTIVASGPNTALPHAIPGDRKIKEGEPLLFDWGAKLNGYCSDTSRTFAIGQPDNKFIAIYNTVLNAQLKAIDMIRPGITGKEVDEVARNHIFEMGYKDKFGHGLGHGTGLAVHEPPRISPLSDNVLEPGMVFTVEPGIYISGWGGVRIENQVVVRDHGVEVLNHLGIDSCK